MKVRFDRNTKIITFESLPEINANDTMCQTLDVDCALSIGETLWVTFKREGNEKTYNSDELQTHDVLLTRFADAGIVSMYFPEEIISNPGTWVFQLLIRTYRGRAVAQEIASNEAEFYVAEGLPFDGENAPVNKHTIASLYEGAQQAVRDAQAIVDNANAITSFIPNVEKTETIEYGQPAEVTIEMRTDADGKSRYLDFEFYIPKGEQGERGEQGPQGNTGPQGPQGPQGPKGEGFKISKTYTSVEAMRNGYGTDDVPLYGLVLINTGNVNDADNAKLFVKGDTEYTLLTDLSGAQGIRGEDGTNGKDGQDGEDGKSAYQIWLDNGHTGTEAVFLESLKGKDGVDGQDGANGKDGTNGKDGVDGQDGKSAYEIWLDEDNEGSEQDFLDSLKPEGVDEQAVQDIIDKGGHTFQNPVKILGDNSIETTYTATGISVWDKNKSETSDLNFPEEEGTLATREWVEKNGGAGGAGVANLQIHVTYDELKALRANGMLIPGHFYRITDYRCTTSQTSTMAESHLFDIIVQAIDSDRLSEVAKADFHEGDEYFRKQQGLSIFFEHVFWVDPNEENLEEYVRGKDIVMEVGYSNDENTTPIFYKTDVESEFSSEPDYQDEYRYVSKRTYNGKTYDLWQKWENGQQTNGYTLTNVVIDDDGTFKTSAMKPAYKIYGNVPLWELRYCLDNDKKRFEWANDSVGKGVIYWMKDEHGNECPYDFKNILFLKGQTWQERYSEFLASLSMNSSIPWWFYTFSWYNGETIEDLTMRVDLTDDEKFPAKTRNNTIKRYYGVNGMESLGGNIIVSSIVFDDGFYYGTDAVKIDENCNGIIIYGGTTSMNFGVACSNIVVSHACRYLTFCEDCSNLYLYERLTYVEVEKNCSWLVIDPFDRANGSTLVRLNSGIAGQSSGGKPSKILYVKSGSIYMSNKINEVIID